MSDCAMFCTSFSPHTVDTDLFPVHDLNSRLYVWEVIACGEDGFPLVLLVQLSVWVAVGGERGREDETDWKMDGT